MGRVVAELDLGTHADEHSGEKVLHGAAAVLQWSRGGGRWRKKTPD
jgi:hypothetical protein